MSGQYGFRLAKRRQALWGHNLLRDSQLEPEMRSGHFCFAIMHVRTPFIHRLQSGPSCSGDVSALPGLEDFWASFPVAYAHRQGLCRPAGPESQRRGTFCRRFAATGRFVGCIDLGFSPEAICCGSFAAEGRRLSYCCCGLSARIRVIRGSSPPTTSKVTSCIASGRL